MSPTPDQTFHQSVAKVLFVAQFFGLLPVNNLLGGRKDVTRLRYSWLSVHTLYATLLLLLNGFEFLTVVNLLFKVGFNFHTSGTVSFFVVCLLEHVYFWRLAIKWPFIMRAWRQTEEVFLRAPYRLYATYNMKAHIYAFSLLVMCSAWLEHIVLMYNSFDKSELERKQCKLNISMGQSLYNRERQQLSLVVPYSVWLLPLAEWINMTLAFPRSFTDVFIICVSIGLATRFRQLYLRIKAVHTKALPMIFWTETREHYLLLMRLLRLLNKEMAPLILLACSNNMFFICFQFFNSFQNIGVDLIAVTAFWYSLLFGIFRTVLTLFIASSVNEYSKLLLRTLRCVPTSSWCIEIQRFSEQLSVDLPALSGSGFFFMTRQLILAMASTIFTYEVMVTDVINKGSIQQRTNYCTDFHANE